MKTSNVLSHFSPSTKTFTQYWFSLQSPEWHPLVQGGSIIMPLYKITNPVKGHSEAHSTQSWLWQQWVQTSQIFLWDNSQHLEECFLNSEILLPESRGHICSLTQCFCQAECLIKSLVYSNLFAKQYHGFCQMCFLSWKFKIFKLWPAFSP